MRVQSGSLAEEIDLKIGDSILEVNGKKLHDIIEVSSLLTKKLNFSLNIQMVSVKSLHLKKILTKNLVLNLNQQFSMVFIAVKITVCSVLLI